jgi:hypothetical protein
LAIGDWYGGEIALWAAFEEKGTGRVAELSFLSSKEIATSDVEK